MIKVTAVSKALIDPCDQIIRSGSRHFCHYVKVRMITTFLIGPSMVDVCCDWFVRFTQQPLTTPGYATDRGMGMLELIVIDTSLSNCYESSCFIGRLDDPDSLL